MGGRPMAVVAEAVGAKRLGIFGEGPWRPGETGCWLGTVGAAGVCQCRGLTVPLPLCLVPDWTTARLAAAVAVVVVLVLVLGRATFTPEPLVVRVGIGTDVPCVSVYAVLSLVHSDDTVW